jgi:hypothetical protein
MAHPYQKYSEHRHGRAVAKARGYQSGGVVNFPISQKQSDLQRLRSSQGVELGRIPKNASDNAVAGPGRFPGSGGIKPSVLRRMTADDMPMKRGGRVKRQMGGGVASVAAKKMRESVNDEKLQEYSRRIEPIRPSASTEVDQAISRQREMDRQSRAPYKKGGKVQPKRKR